jgi:hypothetical protein
LSLARELFCGGKDAKSSLEIGAKFVGLKVLIEETQF